MTTQFFISLPEIGTGTEEDWLLETALKFFNMHHDAPARDLFRQLIKRGGTIAASAQNYLEQIEYRCDELPFAEGLHLWNQGRYAPACQRFMEVVDIGHARKDEARNYLDILKTQLNDWQITGVEESSDIERPGEVIRVEIPFFADPPEWEGNLAQQDEDVVRRTPHMEFLWPGAPRPGITFMVLIYADKVAPRDEESEEIEIEMPPEMTHLELKVTLLLSEHFLPLNDDSDTLTITRGEELSSLAYFRVTVKSEEELAEQKLKDSSPSITALFTYKGRPSGKVRRKITLNPVKPTRTDPASTEMNLEGDITAVAGATEGCIKVDARANSADLNVTILADEEGGDGRKFSCTVQTHLLQAYASEVTRKWSLPQAAPALVKHYMRAFEDKEATPLQRIIMLRGAGIELFNAAPKIFQDLIWELFDEGKLPKTIFIVSEEPYIPWELMIPTRELGGNYQEIDPLGVKFIVGRWPKKGAIPGPQKISLIDSYVIAPTYPERPLKYAKEESELVRKKFNGVEINPATADEISEVFEAAGKTIIHFACHGQNEEEGQVILLDDESPLQTFALRGIDSVRKALSEKKTIVFINACEVGRGAPSLVGVGGFARTFIDMGACAVIAPLWSVKDDIAHQVALEFYKCITEDPSISFAEVFQRLRKKAYMKEDSEDADAMSGEDSYAAYCFYGDPLASRAVT